MVGTGWAGSPLLCMIRLRKQPQLKVFLALKVFHSLDQGGENIDVDILSRPVDKDSNCTELCCVLFLFVLPLTKPL